MLQCLRHLQYCAGCIMKTWAQHTGPPSTPVSHTAACTNYVWWTACSSNDLFCCKCEILCSHIIVIIIFSSVFFLIQQRLNTLHSYNYYVAQFSFFFSLFTTLITSRCMRFEGRLLHSALGQHKMMNFKVSSNQRPKTIDQAPTTTNQAPNTMKSFCRLSGVHTEINKLQHILI